jgi:AraC-like DNA-binding protein
MDNKVSNDKDSILTLKNCRDLVVLIFFGVMSFKLFSINLSLNIEEFGFTDLLAILVAFFAIGLSVAFYFKATDTSNRFYDNSYAFTKDVSEILGRMEAGFGERLRHLDEGYTGIRDKFDKLPFDSAKAMEDIEKENEEIKRKEAEQRKTLEELAQKAHLAANEKSELFEKMGNLNRELEDSKTEARRLEKRLRMNGARKEGESRDILGYLFRKMTNNMDGDLSMKSSSSDYRNTFRMNRDALPNGALHELERYGFIDDDGELTAEAIEGMRMIMRKFA